MQNILVGQEDGEAVLPRLRDKAAHREAFSPADHVALILAPLMRQSRPIQEVLRAVAPLETLVGRVAVIESFDAL